MIINIVSKDGSWICEICENGLEKHNGACRDIDECLGDYCDKVTSKCINSKGSFECQCISGYEGKASFGIVKLGANLEI